MKNTCGFFIYHKPSNSILLGHVSTSKGEWSVPKGKQETDETIFEAALRELYEEANISKDFISKSVVYELQPQVYSNKHKRLNAFLVICDERPLDIKCNSTFVDSFGNTKPEFDTHFWFKFDYLLDGMLNIHPTQMDCLEEIKSLLYA